MNINKILGYFLLILGIGVIIWVLYSSYVIFTGSVQPPEVFSVSEEAQENYLQEKLESQRTNIQDQKERAEQLIKKQIQNMIPTGTFSKLLNLISWSLLAGIMIFGASKMSHLGIKLIKAW